jgi:signal transduction histidine kinase
MAWTTSAGARARPTIAEIIYARLKRAKYRYATLRRSVLRAHPAAFLAASAVTLGVLALLLPTGFIAATLVLSGVTVAVYAAGANLADAVTMARTEQVAVADPAAVLSNNVTSRSAPDCEPPPVLKATKPRRNVPVLAPHHDWADLMSRVNHDLRTPLNAVIGFSEVMALEMFGPLGSARYLEYVRYIRESASDLLKSAEDTLALTALLTNARPAEAAIACTLEHAIADAWTFVERKAVGRDVRLDLMLPDGVEVLAEPRSLRQILVNMLSEAVTRAASGGRVSVHAVADGELIEIILSVDGRQPDAAPRAGSLAICLARTLLEMQGTSLLEIETAAGGWRAVTVLDRAAQTDFFADDTRVQTRELAAVA